MNTIAKSALLANTNQQTTYNKADAIRNVDDSQGRGTLYEDDGAAVDTHKPFVIVGGGSAADFDKVVAAHGGSENVHVALVGSAINRLNKDKQIEAGFPYVEKADSVYINGVDEPGLESHYDGLATALKNHPEVKIYMTSTNGQAAFDALEKLPNPLIKVDPVLEGVTLERTHPESTLGTGSTAPTFAAAVALDSGYKQLDFIGVDGAPLQYVPEDKLSDFNMASQAIVEPERYKDYDIGKSEWTKIPPNNKCRVQVGADAVAELPSGQIYTMQELAKLKTAGEAAGVNFKFHGKDKVATRVLGQGCDMKVLIDPRGPDKLTSGSKKAFAQGELIAGSKPLKNAGFEPNVPGRD